MTALDALYDGAATSYDRARRSTLVTGGFERLQGRFEEELARALTTGDAAGVTAALARIEELERFVRETFLKHPVVTALLADGLAALRALRDAPFHN